jgi:hypothetical protein
VRAWSCTNNLKHPFCWVCIRRTSMSAVAFKVFGKNVSIVPYFSEIHGSTTLGKEEKSVKALKEHGRWLMDLHRVSNLILLQGKKLTVHKTACPFLVSFSIKSQIAQEV